LEADRRRGFLPVAIDPLATIGGTRARVEAKALRSGGA
jgi:hypothetical protein